MQRVRLPTPDYRLHRFQHHEHALKNPGCPRRPDTRVRDACQEGTRRGLCQLDEPVDSFTSSQRRWYVFLTTHCSSTSLTNSFTYSQTHNPREWSALTRNIRHRASRRTRRPRPQVHRPRARDPELHLRRWRRGQSRRRPRRPLRRHSPLSRQRALLPPVRSPLQRRCHHRPLDPPPTAQLRQRHPVRRGALPSPKLWLWLWLWFWFWRAARLAFLVL